MTPESITDPADIRKHVEKFKRQAKLMDSPKHVELVLKRFPAEQRDAIYLEIEPFLPPVARLT